MTISKEQNLMYKTYSSKSYVQDGLVLNFDAIDNIGTGKHDPNSRNWIDLVGGIKLIGSSNTVVKDNFIAMNSTGNYVALNYLKSILENTVIGTKDYTIELRFLCDISVKGTGFGFNFSTVGEQWCYLGFTNAYNPPILQIRPEVAQKVINSKDYAQQYVTIAASRNNFDVYYYVNGAEIGRSKIGEFTGEIRFCNMVTFISAMRMYNKSLADYEIIHNHEIDKERFKL